MRNCKYCCCFRLVPAGDGKKRGKKRKEKSGFFHIFVLSKKVERSKRKKNSHRFPPASLCYSLLSLLVSFLPPWALASRLSIDPCEGRKAFPTRERKRARECFFISLSFCLPFFFIVTVVVATSFSYFRPPTSETLPQPWPRRLQDAPSPRATLWTSRTSRGRCSGCWPSRSS